MNNQWLDNGPSIDQATDHNHPQPCSSQLVSQLTVRIVLANFLRLRCAARQFQIWNFKHAEYVLRGIRCAVSWVGSEMEKRGAYITPGRFFEFFIG